MQYHATLIVLVICNGSSFVPPAPRAPTAKAARRRVAAGLARVTSALRPPRNNPWPRACVTAAADRAWPPPRATQRTNVEAALRYAAGDIKEAGVPPQDDNDTTRTWPKNALQLCIAAG